MGSTFLPERLRPSTPRRRARRRLLYGPLLPVLVLLLLPAWRVGVVEVGGDPVLPAAVQRSLAAVVGTPVVTLDLGWVRALVESWPGVSTVEVALELPSTLRVAATRTSVEGSTPVGHGWHGVAADGGFTGRLSEPRRPLLEGFAPSTEELLTGLEVARRLAGSSGATVEAVRRVTPADYRVALRVGGSEAPVVVHVLPGSTEAERFWCRQVLAGSVPAPISDLRSERRMVLARPPLASVPPLPEASEPSEEGPA